MIRSTCLAVVTVVAISGCSSFGIGESEYGCKGYPQGITCKSAREVYEMDGKQPAPKESSADSEKASSDSSSRRRSARRRSGEETSEEPQRQPSLPYRSQSIQIDGPTPIRTPSRVMRVWVDSYEDTTGDLHVPGLVYTEVEQRTWNIGQQAPQRTSRALTPLSSQQPNGSQ